jgi:hypothetical protein
MFKKGQMLIVNFMVSFIAGIGKIERIKVFFFFIKAQMVVTFE